MKKLVIINLILLFLICIIPIKEKIITKEEVIRNTICLTEKQNYSERIINLEFNINSDLRKPSNLIAEEYNKMLENTNLYGLGIAFEQAEKTYNINGLYLLGLACLESGYGTSGYAVERNNVVRLERS